jgi:GNAT superfamily N-acetyltransferase
MLSAVAASIRMARPADGPALREIERLAGARFYEVGLPAVADDEPLSMATLTRYAMAGRSWVAVEDRDEPVGYVIADVVDAQAHIAQVSVRPDHQGHGIGRALIDRVAEWASEAGRATITLSTFATVPWNGPLYAHLGFMAIPEEEIGAELRELREEETRHGLDPALRICMRRTVSDERTVSDQRTLPD